MPTTTPLVLSHARALLTSAPEGACDYVEGDLREPDKIMAQAARTLGFTKTVALMLLGILRQISDTEQAYSIVGHLVAALAPGSFLAINHSTGAVHGAAMEEAVAHWIQVGTPSMTFDARYSFVPTRPMASTEQEDHQRVSHGEARGGSWRDVATTRQSRPSSSMAYW
jgi:S-adenosyl methyltransferase